MQRNALLTLILGVILFLAHPVHAQFTGDRMRITTEDGEKFIGQLKGYNADSLTILTNSTELSIAYADMVRLQRSLGVRSHYRDGAIIGLGMGVHYGGAIRNQGILTGFWGGLGGLTGMLVGAMIRRERWMPLDIPNQGAAFLIPGIGVRTHGLSALENRMRITTKNGEELVGQLKGYESHSLTILTDSTEQSVAHADIARLQRSLGVRPYHREGAMMGFSAGVLSSVGVSDGKVALGLEVLGGLTGAMVGRKIRREGWKRLDIPDQDAGPVMPIIGVHPAGLLTLDERMRITTKSGEKFIGQLKGYNAYSLTIFTDSTEQSIAHADMARLQRSLGIRSYYRNGAMTGFAVGLLYGIGTSGVGLAIGFGGLGGLTGAMVGTTIRRERWKRLDIPDRGTAFVMPVIADQDTASFMPDIPDQGAASVMPNSDIHPPGLWAMEDRMRITMQHGGEITGQMNRYNADSLTILTDTAELSIAYADMMRLQRSLGVRRYPIEGLVIGLGTGSFWGIRTALNIECHDESCVGAAIATWLSIVIGSGGGALLGLIVGAAIRTEKWERLDIPGQSAASVTPVIGVHPGGSLALGARISF